MAVVDSFGVPPNISKNTLWLPRKRHS